MKAPDHLLFTPEEAGQKYIEFFTAYPVEPDAASVHTVFSDFFKKKDNLRKALRIGDSGRVRIADYEDTTASAEVSIGATLSALTRIAAHVVFNERSLTNMIVENRMKDGAKFSKWILKQVGIHISSEAVKMLLKEKDLCIELPRLPLAKRDDLETVIQNFYSELAALKGVQVHTTLSVSPYDIANASTGKIRSCNSIRGMYESAPICAASSEYVAILRLENAEDELLGRCYVAFSPDLKSFIVQPVYGFMQQAFVDDAKLWLTEMLDRHIGGKAVPWKTFTGDIPLRPGDVCKSRTATFYVDPASSCIFREDYKDVPVIRVGDCICLVCGKSSSKIVCQSCRAKFIRCKHCDAYCKTGETICSVCKSLMRTCEQCGKEFLGRKDNKVNLCGDCRYTQSRCIICHNNISIDKTFPVEECGLVSVLDGVLFAHKSCCSKGALDYTRRCKCGAVRSLFDDLCPRCRAKEHATESAHNRISKFSRVRTTLRTCGAVVNTKPFGKILLPEIEHAIAA